MNNLDLPRPLVAYLNQLFHQEELEAAQGLQVYLQDLRDWLAEQASFLIHPEERTAFQNVTWLLDDLEALALRSSDLTPGMLARRATERAYELEQEFRKLHLERTRLRFVEIPELDQLMLAAVAVLNGRGRPECLPPRLRSASRALARLQADFEELLPAFPGPVQAALLEGFEKVAQGLESLQDGPPLRREAILNLKAGGELLGYLTRWNQARCQSCIPETGPQLTRLANLADQRSPELAREARRYLSQDHPRLQAWWEEHRDCLLLPLELQQTLMAGAEQALRGLEAALERNREVGEAIGELEEAFAELLDCSLQPSRAVGSCLEAPVSALAGAWEGCVPDLILADLFAHLLSPLAPPEARAGAEALGQYLTDGYRQHLLVALEALLEAVEVLQQPEAVLGGLRCKCCNRLFRADLGQHDTCVFGSPHTFYEISA